MTSRNLITLIAVLIALACTAGAAPAPGVSPVQVWPSFSAEAPGSYLGVYLDDVDAERAEELGLPEERGARIDRVAKGGPAEEAGFEPDDVVMSWNGTRVESARQLKRLVTETPAGRKVRVDVFRDGAATELAPVIGNAAGLSAPGSPPRSSLDPHRGLPGWPDGGMWPQMDPDEDVVRAPEPQQRPRLGVAMLPLSEQLAAYFGLEDQAGVLIGSVLKDSAAEEAGLKAGDILLEIDDEPVRAPAEVQQVIARKEGLMDLTILRDRERVSIGAELSARADEEKDEDERSFPRNAM